MATFRLKLKHKLRFDTLVRERLLQAFREDQKGAADLGLCPNGPATIAEIRPGVFEFVYADDRFGPTEARCEIEQTLRSIARYWDSTVLSFYRKTREDVPPTPFGIKRAEEIYAARGQFGVVTMTPGEEAYVQEVWDTIEDGGSSFMTAFWQILNGRVPCPC